LGGEKAKVTMKRRCISVAGLLLILVLPAAAGAKGRFERVTIAEEGSTVETLVTDEALLDFFAFSEFPKQVLAQAPRPTTKAYVVTRGGFTPDGVYHAFDRLHYYPAASQGHSGFVYYDGLVSGWSEYDHKWYAASAEGDRAMSRFIASRLPSAKAHAHIVGLPPNQGASSGRLSYSHPWWPTTVGGFEERRGPATAPLSRYIVGRQGKVSGEAMRVPG
jgi:hypothetical protein